MVWKLHQNHVMWKHMITAVIKFYKFTIMQYCIELCYMLHCMDCSFEIVRIMLILTSKYFVII